MTNTQQYAQFVATMTQAINLQAMRTCNPLISESEVATMPECVIAFNATVSIATCVAGL